VFLLLSICVENQVFSCMFVIFSFEGGIRVNAFVSGGGAYVLMTLMILMMHMYSGLLINLL
jgi:hypothetical protein